MSISPNGIEIEESVHPCDDRAAKKAEELLPDMSQFSQITNPANYRSVVAAALRKAYAEIERLKVLTFCYHAEENVKLQGEIARLETHLPDCCKNETCNEDENILYSDVVAQVMNSLPTTWKITEDEYVWLADKIGDLSHKAVKAAIKDREAEIVRLRAELAAQRRADADIALSYGPDPEAAELIADAILHPELAARER